MQNGITFGLEEGKRLLDEARYHEASALLDKIDADATGADQVEVLRLQAKARRGEGRYEEAIDSLSRCCSVARTIHADEAQAWALIDLGRLYTLLNRPGLAFEALTEANRLVSNPHAIIALLSVLTDLHARVGSLHQAQWLCDQAILTIGHYFKDPDPLIRADVNQLMAERKLALARLAEAQQQYHRALYALEGIEVEARFGSESYMGSATEASLIRQHATAIQPVVDLVAGRVLLKLGELESAQKRLKRAQEVAESKGDMAIVVEAIADLGRVAALKHRSNTATKLLEKAVDLAERWLTYFEIEEFRAGLRTQLLTIYSDLVVLAARTGNSKLAWSTVERARAREFLDSLKTGAGAFQLPGPDVKRLEEFTKRLGALTNRLLEAEPGTPLCGRLREEREAILNEKALYLQEVHRHHRRRLAAVHHTLVPADGVMEWLDNDTALVEYFFAPEEALAFVMTKGTLSVVPLMAHPAAIGRRVQRYVRTVGTFPRKRNEQSWRVLAGEIYQELWAPLTPHLGQKPRVCIVPHGPLIELPFVTLGIDQPLLTRTEIVYAPSASVLMMVDRQPAHALRKVAVLADPLPEGRWSLPGAQKEAEEIKQTPFEVTVCRGAEVTPESVLRAARTADVLHLACHAEFDSQRPLLSAFLVASETGGMGRLETHAIYGAEIEARLIVLSACETGRFERDPAGELQGFVRAFIIAGAGAVIGARWTIDDPATCRLMASLYRALAAGKPPGAALRAAQLSLSAEPAYSHPYYWAAFSLYGDWG